MNDSTEEARSTPQQPASTRDESGPAGRFFFGSDGLRAGWGLLLFAVVYLLVQAALGELARATGLTVGGPGPHGFIVPRFALVNEGLSAAAVVIATWVMTRVERRGMNAFGLARPAWLRKLAEGAAWGLLFLSILVGALKAAGLLVFDQLELHGGALLGFGVVWAICFSLVGFYEELFFRGYLQVTLSRGLAGIYRLAGISCFRAAGFWTAAVLLSFGFGLVHTRNPGESPVGVFAAGAIGLIFCLSLWRTGALWWAIGFHAAWDWAESYLFGVYDSGLLIRGRLFATHPQGQVTLSGGLTGPEGSLLIMPVLILAIAAIVLTLKRADQPSRE